MNNERRKQIEKAIGLLQEASSILAEAASDEQEYFDNMPEGLQSGDKGQQAETAAGALQEAVDEIDNQISNIEDAAA